MIKKKGSLITAIVASLTICSMFTFIPKPASAITWVNKETGERTVMKDETANKTKEELAEMGLYDPNYKSIYAGTGNYVYALDANGNITDKSLENVLKHRISCHLYQKIDESYLRSECAEFGLDFDDLVSKERPQVLMVGWVLNSHGRWYYSANGRDWLSGWQTLGGATYYLGTNYCEYAYTGWNKIDGVWYHFNENTCALDTNTVIDNYTINEKGQALTKAD